MERGMVEGGETYHSAAGGPIDRASEASVPSLVACAVGGELLFSEGLERACVGPGSAGLALSPSASANSLPASFFYLTF